jgi:tyrosine-protein kinase Etk/Wzc
MNTSLPSEPGAPGSYPPEYSYRQSRGSGDSEESGIGDFLAEVWEGRYLLIGSILVFLAFGAFYGWKSTPVYQTEALLQIQPKKNVTGETFQKLEGLFSDPVEAQAEIEILGSNQVLGRVVKSLSLDLEATPILMPVIGDALNRRKSYPAAIDVEAFDIPDLLRGQEFQVIALAGGEYRLEGPGKAFVGQGKVGEILNGRFGSETISLKIKSLQGKRGQKFSVERRPVSHAIDDLRLAFQASERGKLTNVLGLSLKSNDPLKGAEVLNEIINQYVQHNMDKKVGEATRTLATLREHLPVLRPKLDTAENRLNSFRSRSGAVDLSREADLLLQQSSTLNAQVSSLKQKKEELLRTYTERADVITTINQQIGKLQFEASQIESKIHNLPGTEQEVVRLSRDVQVNTELYTALLNSIQQLQVTTAGEMSNITVVDRPIPNLEPIAPKKKMLMILFLFLGSLVGAGLLMLRRALRKGVEDHRLIETKLGMPVFVTIPHSENQDDHDMAIRKRRDGLHLLASLNPEDLATESLRSLRTMLHLSMKEKSSRVIMVTGPSPSIGKSFVSANLAVVLAQAGANVLLVDGDLRRGTLHQYFGLRNRINGLTEVLSGRTEWSSVIRPVRRDESSDTTEMVGLYMMSTGVLPPNPSELLMSNRFTTFLGEVSKAYDYVIIDAPPLLSVTDAAIIASKVDAVMLVAKYGRHPLDELRTCQRRLESHGVRVTGCIFNDVEPVGLGNRYRQYRYAYHYNYKS